MRHPSLLVLLLTAIACQGTRPQPLSSSRELLRPSLTRLEGAGRPWLPERVGGELGIELGWASGSATESFCWSREGAPIFGVTYLGARLPTLGDRFADPVWLAGLRYETRHRLLRRGRGGELVVPLAWAPVVHPKAGAWPAEDRLASADEAAAWQALEGWAARRSEDAAAAGALHLAIFDAADDPGFVSPLLASRRCLECHEGPEGRLLGAVVTRLRLAEEGLAVFDAARLPSLRPRPRSPAPRTSASTPPR